ncbi:MAG: TRAP transporter large permease, partial [Pseudorhodoplanes sp.]|nr:TRAP transporter large permease [Pseudorhodoplanes sp.]
MEWGVQLVLVLGVLFALLMGGMWLPFAILISGLISILAIDGWSGLNALGFVLWGGTNSFTLTSIPLFIFMSDILLRCGVTGPLYRSLARIVRSLPGGLLQTNILASALFAAICGSSVATAAAIGTVALPNLDARGYDRPMSYGSLAAGGTLGILIPPSIPLILYGSFTEVSVAKLFMAGVVPGIGLAFVFMLFIGMRSLVWPSRDVNVVEPDAKLSILWTIIDLAPFTLLMGTVLGGIYLGFATPTEAAALGCLIAIGIGIMIGGFSRKIMVESVGYSLQSSCAILFIVVAAMVFAFAFENASLGTKLTEWILSFKLDRYEFLFALLLLYIALGCLIESIAMIVITVPLLFPTVMAYGIDPLWFAVALVILVELGQLTPPFGINLFVIKRISRAPLGVITQGTVPYYGLMIGFLLLLTLFPQIVTWLPGMMFH